MPRRKSALTIIKPEICKSPLPVHPEIRIELRMGLLSARNQALVCWQ
jgi:hypothetical protein